MTQARIITLATPVFFLLIFLEIAVSLRMKRSVYRADDAINSIGLGVISQIAAVFSRLLTVGIYTAVYARIYSGSDESSSTAVLAESGVVVWVFALLAYDFCYYWLHRMGHEYSILWAAHVVHHQSEEYNLSTALRQTGTGMLFGWIFYIPMAVVGIHPSVMAGVAMIDLLYQFWIHTRLIDKLGWFDRVFASPSNHRIHHAVNDRYLDKNYGGIFIIWDRIFGTFIEEDQCEKIVYGTRVPLRSWNPIWANVEVYSAMLADMLHTRSWTNKLRVLVGRTGWRPDDVSHKFPSPEFDLHRKNFQPVLSKPCTVYGLAQFAVILAAAVHFLQIQNSAGIEAKILYGSWIVLSLTSLGAFMESKRRGIYFEQGRHLITGAAILLSGQWFGTGDLSEISMGSLILTAVGSLAWVCYLAKYRSGNSTKGG